MSIGEVTCLSVQKSSGFLILDKVPAQANALIVSLAKLARLDQLAPLAAMFACGSRLLRRPLRGREKHAPSLLCPLLAPLAEAQHGGARSGADCSARQARSTRIAPSNRLLRRHSGTKHILTLCPLLAPLAEAAPSAAAFLTHSQTKNVLARSSGQQRTSGSARRRAIRLRLRPAPPVERWLLRIPLSLVSLGIFGQARRRFRYRHWRSHSDVVSVSDPAVPADLLGAWGPYALNCGPLGCGPPDCGPYCCGPFGSGPFGWVGIGCQPTAGSAPILLQGHRLRHHPPYARLLRLRCRGARLAAGADLVPPLPAVSEGRLRDGARPMPAGSRRGIGLQLHKPDQESNRNDRDRLRHDARTPPQLALLRRIPIRRISRPRSTAMIPTTRADDGELARMGRVGPEARRGSPRP